jgi:hypothetical protein
VEPPTEENEMKGITRGALAAVIVLTAGIAVAQGGPSAAPGPGRYGGASAATMKKFQKETLALRDELVAKRLDLEEEYDKPEPDQARIASLRKDIVDIEAKIQTAADKYGVRPWGRGYGRGMMYGWNGPGHTYGPGAGCGCCW